MTDHATPNLPARDFAATAAFYARLGFEEDFRDGGWMILSRGDATLEFFPHPDLDPARSDFSCCIRLDDLAAMRPPLSELEEIANTTAYLKRQQQKRKGAKA